MNQTLQEKEALKDTLQTLTSTLKLLYQCNEGTDSDIEEAISIGEDLIRKLEEECS